MTESEIYQLFEDSSGVSIDTRTISENNLFFSLSGENFNGNTFAERALQNGAKAAIIDDPAFIGEGKILVKDSLKALQNLANHRRKKFEGPVLAITGSNGKTTTKELIREVLGKKFNVQATEGNLNNHIGVPLSILKWTKETEIAVVEMGANHVGEIASYCEVVEPTHGLITNIGHAHTETFGGIEGVLRGKTELFDFIRNTSGLAFINIQDQRLKHLVRRFEEVVTFPSDDLKLGDSKGFVSFSLKDSICNTQLTGGYNFSNVAAALAVGQHFGVSDEKILQSIEDYIPTNHRSQIIERGNVTIIMDAYNANPDSMRAALANLLMFKGKKVAILGDMNELSNSDEEHRSLGKELAKMHLDEVTLIGEKIKPALNEIPEANYYSSTEEFIENGYFTKGSCTILLKASRSLRLENVLNIIQD